MSDRPARMELRHNNGLGDDREAPGGKPRMHLRRHRGPEEGVMPSMRSRSLDVGTLVSRLEAKRDAELDQASQLQAVGRDEDAATARACADRAAGLSEALTEVWAWRAGR